MPRYEPYARRIMDKNSTRGNPSSRKRGGLRGDGGCGGRKRGSNRPREPEYNWEQFQREEQKNQINPVFNLVPLINNTPAKPIHTVHIEEGQTGDTPKNLCARWLAKNRFLTRGNNRAEAIVLDDRNIPPIVEEKEEGELDNSGYNEEDHDIIVIEEHEEQLGTSEKSTEKSEESEESIEEVVEEVVEIGSFETVKKDFRAMLLEEDSEDSIVFVGEFPAPQPSTSIITTASTTMTTQIENKMTFQAETFWSSNPTSSSSSSSSSTTPTTTTTTKVSTTTTTRPIMSKINDGFSKDCIDFQRNVRYWHKLKFPLNNAMPIPSNITSQQFTICSYNVLCQKTVARTNYLYRHLRNSTEFLVWNHRWKGLQEELPTFDADILGLQEVQSDHFEEHFQPLMRQHGYEGIYKQKHGTEQKDDGCAIFYRPEKFDRVGYQEVNYFISPNAISNRENIAQILALRCRTTDGIILVANTHLLFNEERGDVKLAQLAILFASIRKMKHDLECFNPPVMVMGDFNIEPNSKIYEFIVNGILRVEGQRIRTMSGQSSRTEGKLCDYGKIMFETTVGCTTSKGLPILDGYIRHPFQFSSVYHYGIKTNIHINKRGISTFHKEAASPDFIFYTAETTRNGIPKLQLLERFALPTFDTLTSAIPWPNKNVPSDHLPIMAKFRLTADIEIPRKK